MRITDLFAVVIHAGSIGCRLGKVSERFWGMCKEKPGHNDGAYTRRCLLLSLCEGQDDGDIPSAIHL